MRKRIAGFLNNMKLQTKFLLIFLLALLLVFGGMLMTSSMTYHAYDEVLYERTLQLLTLFSRNVQTELESVADISFSVIADNILQPSLTTMRRAPRGSTAWMNARRAVEDRLRNLSLLQGDLLSIRLRTADGTEFVNVSSGKTIPSTLMEKAAEASKLAKGRERWFSDEETPGALFLTRDIREVDNLTMTSLGTLVFLIDMDQIIARCSAAMNAMGMPLSCAIDLNGTRVYADQEALMDVVIETGSFSLQQLNDELFFCVSYTPEGSAWAYSAAIPYSIVVRSIRRSTNTSLLVAIAALALAMTVGMMLIMSMLRHFKRLIRKYKLFAQGELQLPMADDPYLQRMDEIGELHRRFDQMAAENQKMIQEIYIKHQLLLEAQILQLRAQIHPHFLYNALESIYCLAERDGNDQIATMTSALGEMLRATLNDKRDIITIGEDLRISQAYLKIQQIRYGDRLVTNFSVDEMFMNIAIPAMTLQPLVENAVQHAAEEMLDICEMNIFCQAVDDYVELVVEDNGPGMAEDILGKLATGEIKPQGLGIGLSNIHRRVQLACGEDCGLYIRRSADKTRVVVRLRRG